MELFLIIALYFYNLVCEKSTMNNNTNINTIDCTLAINSSIIGGGLAAAAYAVTGGGAGVGVFSYYMVTGCGIGGATGTLLQCLRKHCDVVDLVAREITATSQNDDASPDSYAVKISFSPWMGIVLPRLKLEYTTPSA
ncbi:hypothetical protein [uncultured Endozoicomonas sp.]|uniref:hypothetical protein n=1 Tax=uncultured Endozoicomonas sp. TaxID=432652 RepID=UPI00262D1250|nr:hypothetical protein [uncultured Endozoicomonas sp.]